MSACDTPSRSLSARQIDVVHASDSVRHVDELDEASLERFCDAVESRRPVAASEELSLEHGGVVVYTGYYRIEFS